MSGNSLRKHACSYEEFYRNYLLLNIPVIFDNSLVSPWAAFTLWVKRDSRSSPDTAASEIAWDYFLAHYGDLEVTVANCAESDSFGNQERHTTQFQNVLRLWKNGEGQSLYVKDWHLAKQIEKQNSDARTGSADTPFYITPDIFRDDWMNAYYTAHTEDDFRFVYMGAKGTFTPLHRDVYTSYSWSTNVYGRKRWWLFPPDQTPYLFMKHRNVNVYDVRNVNTEEFPDFHLANPIVVEQKEGETIFVPSGWYHQVENLTQCISINHNWCNSVNLQSLYKSMCEKVIEVEGALEDVREILSQSQSDDQWKMEWTRIVQDVVSHDAGWNWLTFWKMVLHALQAITPSVHSERDQKSNEEGIFPLAPAHLRPPGSFILTQVCACYDDFLARDRQECVGELHETISRIGDLLEAQCGASA